MKSKIILITCWYGDYPWFFPLFLHSCGYNPTIDFLIVTDNTEFLHNRPDNVKILNMTFDELRRKFTQKLQFDLNILNAYKLNDFKPAYGFIFDDLISDYNFWGHSDIDVVFGNIRDFITPEITNMYDVISSRHDYIAGCFTLFRNNQIVNRLFMESKDYKRIMSSEVHYCFDECNFLQEYLQEGISIFDLEEDAQSMTYVVKKAHLENRIIAFFDFIIIEGNPGRISWDNGKILYKKTIECMFYHLYKFKRLCKPQHIPTNIPLMYYFSPTKLYFKREHKKNKHLKNSE